ncbi:MAG: class I SAM-dependent methyltransferase [Rhodocyclaceae bacterium]|nr:class I SAM-dependent methyltransferase [Rhodocyclaceae bacterium]
MISDPTLIGFAGPDYFNLIVNRLRTKNIEDAETCVLETLKFLVISSHAGSSFLHGDWRIDCAWHEFILETRRYKSLCEAIRPGNFLEHSGIDYTEYETKSTAQQLHAEELSFLANYVENFGNFNETTASYWTTCHDVCQRMGWSLCDLNQLSRLYHTQASAAEKMIARQSSPLVQELGASLARGEEISADQLIAYMKDFGQRHRNSAAFHFSRFKNDKGQDPYHWMISPTLDGVCRRVLDVGCGAGHALSLFPDSFSLAGIDVSTDEVDQARINLRRRLAQIEVAACQEIPFINNHFDAVICHMTLMLLNPIEAAMTEIARVMTAGGIFSAVIPASWSEIQPHTAEFNALVMKNAKSVYPSYPYIGLGNGRLKSKDSIRSLVFETMGDNCDVVIDDDTFHFRASVEDALLFTTELYWFDLLPAEHREEVKQSFRKHFESLLDDQSKTLLSRPFARLTVQKK